MANWKGNGPNICNECVTKLQNEDTNHTIFGCLNAGPSIDYFNATKAGSYADTFVRNGVVVLPSSELPGSQPIVDEIQSTIQKFGLACKEKSHPNNGPYNEDLTKEKAKKKDVNNTRQWTNIYGDSRSVLKRSNHKATLLRYVQQLCLGIEKHIFPDIHYGKMISNFTASRNHGFNENKGGTTDSTMDIRALPGFNPKTPQSVLQCNKINLLLRFPGLKTIQHYHRDHKEFSVIAIFVLKCHGKYLFHCFRGSHELSFNNAIDEEKMDRMAKTGMPDETDKTPDLSEDDLMTIEAKEGDIIIFASNLVHGGGQSSLSPRENQALDENVPSNISVSFDLSHYCIQRIEVAEGQTKTWPRHKIAIEGEQARSNVYRFKGESPSFAKRIAAGTTEFFTNHSKKNALRKKSSQKKYTK